MPRSITKKENKHLEQHYNKIQTKKEGDDEKTRKLCCKVIKTEDYRKGS